MKVNANYCVIRTAGDDYKPFGQTFHADVDG